MKIKLISPRMTLRPMDSEFKRVMAPSLALLVLAALTPAEHEILLDDENVREINFNETVDLVAITVNIDTSNRAFNIARSYKELGIPVVMGGIFPSVEPDLSLQHCDAVCVGEAEELWPEIINDFQNGTSKRVYFNNRPTNLVKVPLPARHLLNSTDYLYTNIIFTSRGCPFCCNFCYNSCNYVHKIYRNRPIENVIEEIKSLNTRHVMFIDDNFIGNITWTKDLIDAIKPMKLKWNAAVSTNIINYPWLMDDMKESGCQSLFVGFETLNNSSFEAVDKKQNNVERFDKLIIELHSRSIMINASIVFGFDDDHTDVFKKTVDWLINNKVETMTAHILTPYIGTQLFHKLEQEGRIIDYTPEHYNTSHVVFEPKNMTKEELYKGYLQAYEEFYSLKNITKRLPDSKDQWASFLLFNFGYRKFGNIFSKLAKKLEMQSFGRFATRLSYKVS